MGLSWEELLASTEILVKTSTHFSIIKYLICMSMVASLQS